MAWLSVASNNDELVDKLVEHKIIEADTLIERAFRCTDRGFFVKNPTEK
jgi:hypothetical protein